MKHIYILVALFSVLQSASAQYPAGFYPVGYFVYEGKQYKEYQKEKDKIMGKMVGTSGTFNLDQSDYDWDRFAPEDTVLIGLNNMSRRTTVSSFSIATTEVTNAQYKEFVQWVRDSVAHAALGHLIEMPDDSKRVDWKQELDWSDGGQLDKIFYRTEPDVDTTKTRKVLNINKLIYGYPYPKEGIAIYPDTLCWVRDYSYSYNEPMTRNYFSSAVYDNFPVVGVTWAQAMAYCDWKTTQLRKIAAGKGLLNLEMYVSLPTNAEWQCAAVEGANSYGRDERITDRIVYACGKAPFDENGKPLANFGCAISQEGTYSKWYQEEGINTKAWKSYEKMLKKAEYERWKLHKDGYKKGEINIDYNSGLFTTPVEAFPPSSNGLYDMGGNVAEWILDDAGADYLFDASNGLRDVETQDLNPFRMEMEADSLRADSLKNNLIPSEPVVEVPKIAFPKYNTDIDYLKYKADTLQLLRFLWDKERDNYGSNSAMRFSLEDAYYVFMPNLRFKLREILLRYRGGEKKVAKGGSWAQSSAAMILASSGLYSANKGYCTVGFRVVIREMAMMGR